MKNLLTLLCAFPLLLCLGCGGDDDGNGPGGGALTNWEVYSFDQERSGSASTQIPRELPPIRWETELDGYSKSSPVLYNGAIFAAGARTLYRLNADNGNIDWETRFGDNINSQLSLFNGTLYVGDDGRSFTAVNLEDGTGKWSVSLNGDVKSAPCHANGVVYITDDAGGVYALNEADGSVVWALDLNANGATPALKDGRLYFLSNQGVAGGPSQSVVAVDITDGSVVWRTGVSGFSFNAPAIQDDLLVMGTSGHVYGLSLTSGAIIWNTEFPSVLSFPGSPAIADGFVYLGSQTSGASTAAAQLVKLDVNDGTLIWTRTVDVSRFGLSGAPVVGGDVVIIIGDQAGCLAWDTESGDLLWNFTPAPGFAGGSAIVSGGQVFYQDVNRRFYRLGE